MVGGAWWEGHDGRNNGRGGVWWEGHDGRGMVGGV